MFFDLGAGEILGLAIVGMLLLGPERLPKAAAEAASGSRRFAHCHRQQLLNFERT